MILTTLIAGAALTWVAKKRYANQEKSCNNKHPKTNDTLNSTPPPLASKEIILLDENTNKTEELDPQKLEKEVDQAFYLASGNMLLAGTSLILHPLIWLTIPIVIYSERPFFKLAYDSIIKEKRITSYVIDVFLVSGLLVGGFFYTEVIAAWFALLGQKLLIKSENNSKQNIAQLFGEQPRFVWLLSEQGVEVEIPIEALKIGDVILVNAGQVIAVDGIITEGVASIDQHKLTGESQPVEKGIGDVVLASTIVLAGRIGIKTENTGEGTVAMQIAQVLTQTADFKDSLQSRGEAIADKLTLPTLGASALFLPIFGYTASLAVLTNTFGYKMRLFAPASMLSFLDVASQQGILIKDGRSLEILNQVDTIVFDKTGTLTLEQPTVAQIHTVADVSENDVLYYAAGAETGQTHPIAKAILTLAKQRQIVIPTLSNACYEMGAGIQVQIDKKTICVGSESFMLLNKFNIAESLKKVQINAHKQGHSVVFIASDNHVIGAIELQATLRPEAQHIVNDLKQRNMSLYIISGDHDAPTKKLAETLGISNYFANTLPEEKAALIGQLQSEGKSVCFIGDGINDSIALKKANTSISLKGAATIATDTAQIVFMDGKLTQLPELFQLAVKYEENIKSNFLISTIPSCVCIGGVMFFHWGVVIGMGVTLSTLFAGIINSTIPSLKQKMLKGDIVE